MPLLPPLRLPLQDDGLKAANSPTASARRRKSIGDSAQTGYPRRASVSAASPELTELRRKVRASEALTEQLNIVVAAQKDKINELRDIKSLEETKGHAGGSELLESHSQRLRLLQESKRRKEQSASENKSLQERLRRLATHVKDINATIADLQRVNKRYMAMTSQLNLGIQSEKDAERKKRKRAEKQRRRADRKAKAEDAQRSQVVRDISLLAKLDLEMAKTGDTASSRRRPQAIATLTLPKAMKEVSIKVTETSELSPRSHHRSPTGGDPLSPRRGNRLRTQSGNASNPLSPGRPHDPWSSPAPDSPRSARSARSKAQSKGTLLNMASVALWRESTPQGVLSWLLRGASQILMASMLDGAPQELAVTLYVVDPMLQQSMAEKPKAQSTVTRPTIFKLPLPGISTPPIILHAYRRDGGRPEPPFFAALSDLPFSSDDVLVLPLKAEQEGSPVLAALQICAARSQRDEPLRDDDGPWKFASTSPREEDEPETPRPIVAVSPLQKIGLQLLCGTTVGILLLRSKIEAAQCTQARIGDCLSIVGDAYGSTTIAQFDRVVKARLQHFFGASRVRLLYFQQATNDLLTMAEPETAENGNLKMAMVLTHSGGFKLGKDPTADRFVRLVKHVSCKQGAVGCAARKRETSEIPLISQAVQISETADDVSLNGIFGSANMLVGAMRAEGLPESGWGGARAMYRSAVVRQESLIGVIQLIGKSQLTYGEGQVLGQAGKGGPSAEPGAKPASFGSKQWLPFSAQDLQFFEQVLSILGLAAFRTMQGQSAAQQVNKEEIINLENLLL